MQADHNKIARLLKTAQGQLEGILRMVEEDRYCLDISSQIMAADAILRRANREVLQAHLDRCVLEAVESGDQEKAREKLSELAGVLEKLMKSERIKKYPEDTELLEDVIIENKQAIEMANIYSGNLNVTTEAVASVISNNLNIVMKLLTTITLVMSIPTMIASFYGMNVLGIPFAMHPQGFWIVIGFTAVLSLVLTLIFSKKDLF